MCLSVFKDYTHIINYVELQNMYLKLRSLIVITDWFIDALFKSNGYNVVLNNRHFYLTLHTSGILKSEFSSKPN